MVLFSTRCIFFFILVYEYFSFRLSSLKKKNRPKWQGKLQICWILSTWVWINACGLWERKQYPSLLKSNQLTTRTSEISWACYMGVLKNSTSTVQCAVCVELEVSANLKCQCRACQCMSAFWETLSHGFDFLVFAVGMRQLLVLSSRKCPFPDRWSRRRSAGGGHTQKAFLFCLCRNQRSKAFCSCWGGVCRVVEEKFCSVENLIFKKTNLKKANIILLIFRTKLALGLPLRKS